MSQDTKKTLFIYAVYITAAIVLGLAVTSIIPQFPVISDFADYDALGVHLAEYSSYTTIDDFISPPLYPTFLAILYKTFGHDHLIVYIFQFILLGGIAGTTHLIANKYLLARNWLASLGGIAVLLWPYFILYSLLISIEVLYSLLFAISMLFFLRALQNPTTLNFSLSGGLIALACLARPILLLLPIWLLLWISIGSYIPQLDLKSTWLKIRSHAVAFLTAFVLVLLPWVGYVYVKFDQLIPVSSNFSAVWEKGNESLGYLGTQSDGPEKQSLNAVAQAKVQNVYMFWNPGAGGYQMERLVEKIPVAKIFIYLYYTEFLLVLAAGLFALFFARTPNITILWLTIAYVWGVHTALFPYPRYTLPIIPFVVAVAIYTVHTVLNKYESRLPAFMRTHE